MRYNFYTSGKKVICVSSYAGKAVRGVSKCDPKDEFNLEDGKKLSQLRCDVKIALKRVKRAREKALEATRLVGDAREYQEKMQSYYDESFKDLVKLKSKLEVLEKSL